MESSKQVYNLHKKIMKAIIFVFLAIYGIASNAQEKPIKKPEYVIIVNDKIVTMKDVDGYDPQDIKSMTKGVSEKTRNELAKKFGDKIGDKEFIIIIDLFTDKELAEKNANAPSKPIETAAMKDFTSQFKLKINDAAKDFTVEMINGVRINLADLKGKVVLLNFWATWCAPCLMEFAEIPEKILTPFKGKGFAFIPISIGENKEKVAEKMADMKKYGVHFNSGIDPEKKIWNQYATGSIPKSCIIDKKGVVRYLSVGNAEGNVDKLAAEIEKLLKE